MRRPLRTIVYTMVILIGLAVVLHFTLNGLPALDTLNPHAG